MRSLAICIATVAVLSGVIANPSHANSRSTLEENFNTTVDFAALQEYPNLRATPTIVENYTTTINYAAYTKQPDSLAKIISTLAPMGTEYYKGNCIVNYNYFAVNYVAVSFYMPGIYTGMTALYGKNTGCDTISGYMTNIVDIMNNMYDRINKMDPTLAASLKAQVDDVIAWKAKAIAENAKCAQTAQSLWVSCQVVMYETQYQFCYKATNTINALCVAWSNMVIAEPTKCSETYTTTVSDELILYY